MRALAILLLPALLQAQSVAFTFDDGPALGQKVMLDAQGKNRAILEALREAHVQSCLFVAGHRCLESPEGVALVRAWGEAGHLIANHTYSHGSFHSEKTTVEDFEADFLRNDALIRGLPGYTRWFRFPYLKEGNTEARRDRMRAFLKAQGYRNGNVTIDASDWYYDGELQKRLEARPGLDLAPWRKAYLDHIWDRARYYDGLARATQGRSIAHVLLLHHNLTSALFLGDAIRMFRENGWKVVSPAEAYRDPVYALEPRVVPAGESLLWSLAKEKGLPGLRYPGEDDRYEKPILERLGL
jgi:peptidoglycan/xylan/chitin deacetylase (PgdA/CDA1 family)